MVVLARRKDRLDELRSELEQSAKVKVVPLVADLSDAGDVERALAELLAGPPIYAAILNAAVTHFGPYEALSAEKFAALLSTNVTSVVSFASALIPRIERDQPGGGVLFVSSLAGLQPVPFQSAYSGSKAFVVNFACGLWHELRGRDVSITTFAPGGIVTEMTAGESFGPLSGFLMPANACARAGLEAFRKRDYLYVSGATNRLGELLGRFLPRRFRDEHGRSNLSASARVDALRPLLRKPQLFQLVVQRTPTDTEDARGERTVVVGVGQRFDHGFTLGVATLRIERARLGLGRSARAALARCLTSQLAFDVLAQHEWAVVQHDQALYEILQLPHVAGPRLAGEQRAGIRGQRAARAAIGFRGDGCEVARQHDDVARTRTQRRHLQRHHVQAIEEVLTEGTALNHALQITMCGG